MPVINANENGNKQQDMHTHDVRVSPKSGIFLDCVIIMWINNIFIFFVWREK